MSALPYVTAFPTLPRPSRAATRPAPASPLSSGESFGAIFQPLRALAACWNRLAAARCETRLRRATARGKPIDLGTPERPYAPASPAAGRPDPWEILGEFDGLTVRVVTRPAEILRQLPALAELDRRHAVAVDLVVAGDEPDLGPTVQRLVAEGITTRVLLRLRGRAARRQASLRRLFETARRAGAFDLQIAGSRPGRDGARRFRRLRLEHGFPHPQPGRG